MAQHISQSQVPPPTHPPIPSGPSWRYGIIRAAKQPFIQIYTHILYVHPPSYGLRAIPGMSKMVSPLVSPLFSPDDGDPHGLRWLWPRKPFGVTEL